MKDPSQIGCPSPPAGWKNPPGSAGKSVIDPPMLGNSASRDQIAVVFCDYFASNGSGKHVLVDVSYALPSDPNPGVHFYFGCASGGTSWSATGRTYRVQSTVGWALAHFSDPLRSLDAREVSAFEVVARTLLASTKGYAQGCGKKAGQGRTTTQFTYSFESTAGSGSGQFQTTGVAVGKASVPVGSASTPTVRLTLAGRAVVLKVTHGLRFYAARPGQKEEVVLGVRVLSSKLTSCGVGNSGSRVLTTSSLEVRLCSRSFSGGKTTARISFIYEKTLSVPRKVFPLSSVLFQAKVPHTSASLLKVALCPGRSGGVLFPNISKSWTFFPRLSTKNFRNDPRGSGPGSGA